MDKKSKQEEYELKGGRLGCIFTDGKLVTRPAKPWSSNVHSLLRYLNRLGLDFVPKAVALKEGETEQVTYLEGNVYNYPLCEEAYSASALTSAAQLLRKYHDACRGFLKELDGGEIWMLEPKSPAEVVCHGDFAPYNVVIKDRTAIGIIDFDTIHPGPVAWDVAYALYRWCPFKAPSNPCSVGTLEEQIKRARLFCDAYGLASEIRNQVAQAMLDRLELLVRYMHHTSEAGDKTFAENMKDGHDLLYLADIEYIKGNRLPIEDGIQG